MSIFPNSLRATALCALALVFIADRFFYDVAIGWSLAAYLWICIGFLWLRTPTRQRASRGTCAVTAAVARVNRIVRGWGNYFHYRSSSRAFAQSNDWLRARYRHWLWKKHKRKHSYYGFFNNAKLHGTYKLHKLPMTANHPSLW